jgi:hypothetical protein
LRIIYVNVSSWSSLISGISRKDDITNLRERRGDEWSRASVRDERTKFGARKKISFGVVGEGTSCTPSSL